MGATDTKRPCQRPARRTLAGVAARRLLTDAVDATPTCYRMPSQHFRRAKRPRTRCRRATQDASQLSLAVPGLPKPKMRLGRCLSPQPRTHLLSRPRHVCQSRSCCTQVRRSQQHQRWNGADQQQAMQCFAGDLHAIVPARKRGDMVLMLASISSRHSCSIDREPTPGHHIVHHRRYSSRRNRHLTQSDSSQTTLDCPDSHEASGGPTGCVVWLKAEGQPDLACPAASQTGRQAGPPNQVWPATVWNAKGWRHDLASSSAERQSKPFP